MRGGHASESVTIGGAATLTTVHFDEIREVPIVVGVRTYDLGMQVANDVFWICKDGANDGDQEKQCAARHARRRR